MSRDPFADLGLPAGPDVSDDEVRAAWRRIAAASHPDRADGGDTERFARASAAYSDLRTRYGRGEAWADLVSPGRLGPDGQRSQAGRHAAGPAPAAGRRPGAVRRLAWRVRQGRPAWLLVRVGLAGVVSGAAFGLTGASAAAIGVAVGAATWLSLTVRHDLAPPAR